MQDESRDFFFFFSFSVRVKKELVQVVTSTVAHVCRYYLCVISPRQIPISLSVCGWWSGVLYQTVTWGPNCINHRLERSGTLSFLKLAE